MDFIKDNNESIMGFLDREYITEEGNVICLNCGKKNLSDNVLSIKIGGLVTVILLKSNLGIVLIGNG